jgi:hypothetical protein
MVIAVDFSGLHAWAQGLAVLLLLELCLLLLIVTALVGVLAFGAWWLRANVVPLLGEYAPKARQALDVANQGTQQVVRGVAVVYALRRAVETGVDIMLHGKEGMSRGGVSPAGQVAQRAVADTTAAMAGAQPSSPVFRAPPGLVPPANIEERRPLLSSEEERREPRGPTRGPTNLTAHAG